MKYYLENYRPLACYRKSIVSYINLQKTVDSIKSIEKYTEFYRKL